MVRSEGEWIHLVESLPFLQWRQLPGHPVLASLKRDYTGSSLQTKYFFLYSFYKKKKKKKKYSRPLMARTSLGPWKFVRDIGSSSH